MYIYYSISLYTYHFIYFHPPNTYIYISYIGWYHHVRRLELEKQIRRCPLVQLSGHHFSRGIPRRFCARKVPMLKPSGRRGLSCAPEASWMKNMFGVRSWGLLRSHGLMHRRSVPSGPEKVVAYNTNKGCHLLGVLLYELCNCSIGEYVYISIYTWSLWSSNFRARPCSTMIHASMYKNTPLP